VVWDPGIRKTPLDEGAMILLSRLYERLRNETYRAEPNTEQLLENMSVQINCEGRILQANTKGSTRIVVPIPADLCL